MVKRNDPGCILQSPGRRGFIISPMNALECSLLNRRNELLLLSFSTPFTASASPEPEKVPVRGDGGRVGDSGLALYGDFWTGPRDLAGHHFRDHGDDLRARWMGRYCHPALFGFWRSGGERDEWINRYLPPALG